MSSLLYILCRQAFNIQCFGSYTYLQPKWTFRGQGKLNLDSRQIQTSTLNPHRSPGSCFSLSLARTSAGIGFVPASSSNSIELGLESKPRTFGTRRGIQSLRYFYSISFRDPAHLTFSILKPARSASSRTSPPRLRSIPSTSNIQHSPSTFHHPPSTIHHPPSTIHHPTPQPHTTPPARSFNPQPSSCIPTADGLKDSVEIGVGVELEWELEWELRGRGWSWEVR
ncbi:hypothetical protein C8R47DRAFT_723883 [Mycena vitilis]|nr:hypothetical protein C8R47DRAFT_723883 [Mycena vitilis]